MANNTLLKTERNFIIINTNHVDWYILIVYSARNQRLAWEHKYNCLIHTIVPINYKDYIKFMFYYVPLL